MFSETVLVIFSALVNIGFTAVWILSATPTMKFSLMVLNMPPKPILTPILDNGPSILSNILATFSIGALTKLSNLSAINVLNLSGLLAHPSNLLVIASTLFL